MKTPTTPRAKRKPIAAWLTLALLGAAGGESWAVEDSKRGTARRAHPGVVAKQPVVAARQVPGHAAQRAISRTGAEGPGRVGKGLSKRLEDLAKPRPRNAAPAQAPAAAAEVNRPAPAAPKRGDARVAAKPVAGAQRALAPSMIDRLRTPVLQSRRGVAAKPVAQAAGAAGIGASLSAASTGELPNVASRVEPDRAVLQVPSSGRLMERVDEPDASRALEWRPAHKAAEVMLDVIETLPGAGDDEAMQRARAQFDARKFAARHFVDLQSNSLTEWLGNGGLQVCTVSTRRLADWLAQRQLKSEAQSAEDSAQLHSLQLELANAIADAQAGLRDRSVGGFVFVRLDPELPYAALPDRGNLLLAALNGEIGNRAYVVVRHDPASDKAREIRMPSGEDLDYDEVPVDPTDRALACVSHVLYAAGARDADDDAPEQPRSAAALPSAAEMPQRWPSFPGHFPDAVD